MIKKFHRYAKIIANFVFVQMNLNSKLGQIVFAGDPNATICDTIKLADNIERCVITDVTSKKKSA